MGRLLGSIPGDNFLKLASERIIEYAPRAGDCKPLLSDGLAILSTPSQPVRQNTGNELPLTSQQHWTLIVMLPSSG